MSQAFIPANYYRIADAIRYLETHFKDQPSLEELAVIAGLSPFHFQRLFSEWAGISPKRFLQFLTVEHLKEKLEHAQNLLEVADHGGLSAQSRVYDLFTTLEAVTPKEYRENGSGMTIRYGFHNTLFGLCLIGITTRGVCWLSFLTDTEHREQEVTRLQAHWNQSTILHDHASTGNAVEQVFHPATGNLARKLHLIVRGTNFQVKVWQALLRVPAGEVITYQQVAREIYQPRALQAVGSAVGANSIAWLIPCHRVIRKDGIIGEYRWGTVRKMTMLGLEMAAGEKA